MVVMDEPCFAINEDGASREASLRLLFPEGLGQATRKTGHVLV
jgi:hypothetical protein